MDKFLDKKGLLHTVANIEKGYAKKSEIPDVSSFITSAVDNLVNYYKKSETYTQEQVNTLIGNLHSISMQKVDALPVTGESNIIYLVPRTTSETNNIFDEYIYIESKWEKIGSTDIDLSGYVTIENLNQQLLNYVTNSSLTQTLQNYALSSEIPDVSSFITKSVNDLENYNNKENSYNKTQIDNLLNQKLGNINIVLATLTTVEESA